MRIGKIAAVIAAMGVALPAMATNGYFSHGFGIKSKGMGGVGIALPQDALAAAANPAGMVFVGDRIDFGVDWFRPVRGTEVSGSPVPGMNGDHHGSDTKNFLIPEFGYNRMLNPNLSLGVSVYGNGGMNTDYGDGIPLFGTGKAGVNMMQLFISPTVAYKLTSNHAVGFSLNLVHQRFAVDGLTNFTGTGGPPAQVSVSPGNVTNRDNDKSNGYGFRIGYTGKLSDMVTVGATYQSKTRMGEFDRYKGLFAEQGNFDIPENYGVGIAVQATPALTLAVDVVEIKYSGIDSVSNKVSNLTVKGQALGSDNGPGFGWRDTTVVKLGASYQFSPTLVLRAGYNHGEQPIPKSETFLNILAPGVIKDHLTLGATWTLANKDELTIGYTHAFSNKVKGPNAIPAAYGGGNVDLKMYQDSLGIAYGWKM